MNKRKEPCRICILHGSFAHLEGAKGNSELCCRAQGNRWGTKSGERGEVQRKRKGARQVREREWVRCDRCDGEVYEGAEYYQINGQCVCRECLEEFAGHWFAPFRLIAGEEL